LTSTLNSALPRHRFQGAGLGGSNLQIWLLKIKARYREMIFRVLKQN